MNEQAIIVPTSFLATLMHAVYSLKGTVCFIQHESKTTVKELEVHVHHDRVNAAHDNPHRQFGNPSIEN